MIITYFDEVKYEVGRSQYYWIGGLAATPGAIWNLEQGVSEISRDVFGTICASKDTEFYAADIFHRKRNFKSRDDLDNRITVLERLISVIDSQDEIGKIYVRVEPEAMVKPEYEEIAFMFFVEKVESYLV